MMHCVLCSSSEISFFHQDKLRKYFICASCALIFADPLARLLPAQEKAYYDLHQNNPDDLGYRNFLNRLCSPLVEKLKATTQRGAESTSNIPQQTLLGLDFGSGAGSPLPPMLEEQGFATCCYDIHYYPDKALLESYYDFITCTESIEHFHEPQKELELILSLLKPFGLLGIMTKLCRGLEAFKTWHYTRDPTHVSFFSSQTFLYIANKYNLKCQFYGDDVIFLQKSRY